MKFENGLCVRLIVFIAPVNAVTVSWLYRKMTLFLGTHVNIFSSKVVVSAKNCQIVQQEKSIWKYMCISLDRYISVWRGRRKSKQMGEVYCILIFFLALPCQFKIFQNNKLAVMNSVLLGVWVC